MADNVGQVLVVSCSSFLSSEDIIREMCKTEFSSPKELSNGSLIAYQWKIENKYYTADVQLCASSVSSLPPQCEFAANMNFQSVIIAFDLSEKSSFHNVKSWLPYVETQDPSVLLLLDSGKGNSSKESAKSEVVKWCLNNSFEFIEMNSEEEETEEEEDDFQEKTGIDRVVEALQCAEWPNMKMRENPRSHKSSEGTQQAKAVLSNDEKLSSNQAAAAERPPVFPLPTDDLELLSCLASDGNDNESFEELFQKLAVMKERASSLPATERKDYAEKCLEKLLIVELVLLVTNLENVEKTVAIAFWRALGGSEEEIAGLGENDGDNSEDGEK